MINFIKLEINGNLVEGTSDDCDLPSYVHNHLNQNSTFTNYFIHDHLNIDYCNMTMHFIEIYIDDTVIK